VESIYKISYQIGQVGFELESSDKNWVEKKEKEYIELISKKPAIPRHEEPPISQTETIDANKVIRSNISIQEFYNQYIKSNKIISRPNIAVFFIYYLQKIVGRQEIITQDVVQCFADIAYPNYNKINMTDTLNQGKRKALLNNINKTWSLTLTGEDFVMNFISGGE
jgi:hypothetical protein